MCNMLTTLVCLVLVHFGFVFFFSFGHKSSASLPFYYKVLGEQHDVGQENLSVHT